MSATNTQESRPPSDGGRAPDGGTNSGGGRRSNRALWAVLAVCIAPVIASYTAYYLMPPSGRTNYGDLLSPQLDIKQVQVAPIVVPAPLPEQRALPIAPKEPTGLSGFGGRWVMVVPADAACNTDCRERLYNMRQVRLTTGKHRSRVERLWLLTDDADPDPKLLSEHAGMWVARIDPQVLAESFPATESARAGDHIYIIDPLGNLMMRFPVNADPNRMKKDISRLLKASRVG